MRKRLIPCIFLKNGLIIRSEGFKTHQIIGNPITELARYNEWAVDEIIYIDISREQNYDFRRDDHKYRDDKVVDRYSLVQEISKSCFVPLSFGGGIRTIEDIRIILANGADKVVLNTILSLDDGFLNEASKIFGSQALIACVDYIGDTVFFNHATQKSSYKILEWCQKLERQGIGEIVLNSVERDGMANGYDTKTVDNVVKNVKVPVIALGGAGDYYDFVEALQVCNPSAVAAGNIFHFKELSYYHAKQALMRNNIDIRQEFRSFNII